MRDHDKLTAYLLELLAPLGPISARRMFGGVGLFHGGMMFGLIARDELFLKVSDANRAAYEAAERPRSAMIRSTACIRSSHTGDVRRNCWTIAENFQDWARQAVEAAVAAARSQEGGPQAPERCRPSPDR